MPKDADGDSGFANKPPETNQITMAPKPLTPTKRQCVKQLEDWDEQIADLLAFIGPAVFVRHRKADLGSWEWANEARRRLDKLKRELRVEAAALEQRELTALEANYYARPIEQTAAYLTLQASSMDGAAWRQELSVARARIVLAIAHIKERP
jgi:hypothetical protein